LGILVKDKDKEDVEVQQQPARKKARVNNPLTSSTVQVCKCGSGDHRRVSSRNCPWKGLTKKEIFKNYETRLKDVKAMEAAAKTTGCTVPTKDVVQPTSKFLAPILECNFGMRWYATIT
jgi:hypothetical protein